jgi:hypothetical protein
VIIKMLKAREKKLNEKCNEIVISRSNMASDQSTMDSIVSAQHGLYTVHEMMQIANIAMLKIWSILISKADKVISCKNLFLLVIKILVRIESLLYNDYKYYSFRRGLLVTSY